MESHKNDIIMTRKEIAKHFRIAPDTVTRWTRQGLPALYIGKIKTVAKGARPRYSLHAVTQWLENQQSGVVW